MSIKYKLLFIGIISFLGIVMLGVLLYTSMHSLDGSLQKNTIANQMAANVFERRFFLDEYILGHLDRSKQQWLISHQHLVDYVQSQAPKFSDPKEQEIIVAMQENFNNNRDLFIQLTQAYEATKDQPTMSENAKQARLITQLVAFSQLLIASTNKLTAISQENAASAQNNIAMILTCFIVILSIGNIIIILFFWKSIVFPIRKLQNGAEQIGEGNLDYKINIKSNDEIGQLSTSFDQMAQKVKERTTKLDASLQQLKASNQQLLASNQQLDAATQQLRAANQQLVAVENGLREKIRELEVFNKATVGRELKMAELKKQITNLQK